MLPAIEGSFGPTMVVYAASSRTASLYSLGGQRVRGGRWERCELALHGGAVALGGRDLREERVERGRLHERVAGEIVEQQRHGRDVGRPVVRRREHDPARFRRRLVGDLRERGDHALRSQRGGPGLLNSASRAGRWRPRARRAEARRDGERLRGRELLRDRRERGVAHHEPADEHLRELIDRGGVDRIDERGARIGDLAGRVDRRSSPRRIPRADASRGPRR